MDKMISVIIPVYNAQQTIDRCLDSICTQSYRNIEIVAIDDGSTDKSLDVLNSRADSDERIKVYSQANKGAASARNYGIDRANGEYIAFVDADDYLMPDIYVAMVRCAEETNCDVVCASIREVFKGDVTSENLNGADLPVIHGTEAVCNMLTYTGGIRVMVWDKLYRKSAVNGIRFEEKYKYSEDALFNFQVLLRNKRIARIPNVGYVYDHRYSSVTGGSYNGRILDNIDAVDDMRMLLNDFIIGNEGLGLKVQNDLRKALDSFQLQMYRQIFHIILRRSDYRQASRYDYEYLRDKAACMKKDVLKTHLSFKHRVQWMMYLLCPTLYVRMDNVVNVLKS